MPETFPQPESERTPKSVIVVAQTLLLCSSCSYMLVRWLGLPCRFLQVELRAERGPAPPLDNRRQRHRHHDERGAASAPEVSQKECLITTPQTGIVDTRKPGLCSSLEAVELEPARLSTRIRDGTVAEHPSTPESGALNLGRSLASLFRRTSCCSSTPTPRSPSPSSRRARSTTTIPQPRPGFIPEGLSRASRADSLMGPWGFQSAFGFGFRGLRWSLEGQQSQHPMPAGFFYRPDSGTGMCWD